MSEVIWKHCIKKIVDIVAQRKDKSGPEMAEEC